MALKIRAQLEVLEFVKEIGVLLKVRLQIYLIIFPSPRPNLSGLLKTISKLWRLAIKLFLEFQVGYFNDKIDLDFQLLNDFLTDFDVSLHLFSELQSSIPVLNPFQIG